MRLYIAILKSLFAPIAVPIGIIICNNRNYPQCSSHSLNYGDDWHLWL